MVTGELKARVDRIWDAFWSGGIANPLEVMEQITYLLFIRRLDDLQIAAENKTNRLGGELDSPPFPPGDDETGAAYEDLRWSRLRSSDPRAMFETVSERVFPFLRRLGGDGSTYSQSRTLPAPARSPTASAGSSARSSGSTEAPQPQRCPGSSRDAPLAPASSTSCRWSSIT